MKHKIIFVLVIIISVTGCAKKSHIPPPENLIEREQLIPVIIDLHLANAIQTERPVADNRIERFYKYIWDKHDISSKQFEESIKYYSTNPDEMKAIYKTVLDSLNQIKTKTRKSARKKKES